MIESTLEKLIAHEWTVRVSCTVCHSSRELDLVALAGRVGGDYRLFNRRCRCRMKRGCTGWNRFFLGPGYPRRMWSERTELRWINEDWEARKAADPAPPPTSPQDPRR